jgi:uncharacterized repeat protein (TIGR04138 family)
MLGQPEPVFPVRCSETTFRGETEFHRTGFVSLWVGTFRSVEEAEAYFGIPDEIGVYLPAEAFAEDMGLSEFRPQTLEVNFEQVSPRPLRELLRDATFAASFLDQAVGAARRQGIDEVQGTALLYDFDFRLKPALIDLAGPMRFIGAFPFVQASPQANLQPFQDLAREIGYPVGAVLFVVVALEELCNKRRQERGVETVQISAREHCEHLLGRCGADTAEFLRELGLRRSEDVGRIVFGMIHAGLARRNPSNSESDFQGLFVLGDPCV